MTPELDTGTRAVRDVLAERERQIKAEGWSVSHDDEHDQGEMARAAACYAYLSTLQPDDKQRHVEAVWGSSDGMISVVGELWPAGWSTQWLKPKDRRRDLVRAAALLIAEIERLDRAESQR